MRSVILAAVLSIGVSAALAQKQTAPARPASSGPVLPEFREDQWRRRNDLLVNRWQQGFSAAYQLTDPQKADLKKVLDELAVRDVDYFVKNKDKMRQAQTEYVQLARQMIELQQSKSDPKEIERVKDAQVKARTRYLDMQRGGPLTEDAVLTSLDKMLPDAQAKMGRSAYLANKPQYNSGIAGSPANPGQRVGDASNNPSPAAGALQPTLTRKVTLAAPPPERWPTIVERWVAERQMDEPQVERAHLILGTVMPRVEQAIKSPPKAPLMYARSATVDGLDSEFKQPNHELDLLFDELVQRVEHSLRFEQQKLDELNSPRYAPDPERWDTIVANIILDRHYDKVQAEAARKLLEEYRAKAAAEKAKIAPELAAALKTEEIGKRTVEYDRIVKPYDSLYQEFAGKVEKLSRIEQIPVKVESTLKNARTIQQK